MDRLKLKQISRKVEQVRPCARTMEIKGGWIRCLRQALGMKLKDLAQITGLSAHSITELEQREVQGKVTVNKLKQMAEAMNCKLVYAFLPKQPLEEYVNQRAHQRALEILKTAEIHMTLEEQQVDVDFQERLDRLREKILSQGEIW